MKNGGENGIHEAKDSNPKQKASFQKTQPRDLPSWTLSDAVTPVSIPTAPGVEQEEVDGALVWCCMSWECYGVYQFCDGFFNW